MRKTYIYKNGRLIKKPEIMREAVQIMPDIHPYKSMITGELIGSRSSHRQHLREHSCIEVGNE